MNIPDRYKHIISNRSFVRYHLGLFLRFLLFIKYSSYRMIARMRGAQIGANSIINFKLAIKANKNLVIGEDTIIETCNIDLRNKVIIGCHCIINKNVEIVRLGHIIDNNCYFETKYYPPLVISDYCWIATGSKLLPNVTLLSKGTVVGAYSVVVKNTDEMGVYSGFPAVELRKHTTMHDKLIVVSLKGGDFIHYLKVRYAN